MNKLAGLAIATGLAVNAKSNSITLGFIVKVKLTESVAVPPELVAVISIICVPVAAPEVMVNVRPLEQSGVQPLNALAVTPAGRVPIPNVIACAVPAVLWATIDVEIVVSPALGLFTDPDPGLAVKLNTNAWVIFKVNVAVFVTVPPVAEIVIL